MPSHHRKEKIEEIIKEKAAEFLSKESGGQSLITVTRVIYEEKGNRAKVFYTVFPDHKEPAVRDFLRRNVDEFKDCVKNETSLGRIPFFTFEPDLGEKNRQNIDEISNKVL